MSESNAELARRGWEAASRGDFDSIAELLADDVSWHGGDPDAAGACHGREEALSFMRRATRSGGGVGELVDVVEAGEKVVVVIRPSGAAAGDDADLGANLTTFRHGKAIEMVHYANASEALAAIGR